MKKISNKNVRITRKFTCNFEDDSTKPTLQDADRSGLCKADSDIHHLSKSNKQRRSRIILDKMIDLTSNELSFVAKNERGKV